MSTRSYFWWKTKWFWKHPLWYVLLSVFFVNVYFGWFGLISPSWHTPAAVLTALVMGFVGSSAMICVDLSRGYHKH